MKLMSNCLRKDIIGSGQRRRRSGVLGGGGHWDGKEEAVVVVGQSCLLFFSTTTEEVTPLFSRICCRLSLQPEERNFSTSIVSFSVLSVKWVWKAVKGEAVMGVGVMGVDVMGVDVMGEVLLRTESWSTANGVVVSLLKEERDDEES